MALCGNGFSSPFQISSHSPLCYVHTWYAHGVDRRIFFGTMGFNWLSTRRSWSRPDLRLPTVGQTPSFHSPQIWWGLPRCVPIQNSPFHLVLTRKCVGDRQVIEIWCHFSHCASHLLRPDFIPTASSPSQPSQVPSYTRLIPRSHYHFHVRISAALPRITLIRVAL